MGGGKEVTKGGGQGGLTVGANRRAAERKDRKLVGAAGDAGGGRRGVTAELQRDEQKQSACGERGRRRGMWRWRCRSPSLQTATFLTSNPEGEPVAEASPRGGVGGVTAGGWAWTGMQGGIAVRGKGSHALVGELPWTWT